MTWVAGEGYPPPPPLRFSVSVSDPTGGGGGLVGLVGLQEAFVLPFVFTVASTGVFLNCFSSSST